MATENIVLRKIFGLKAEVTEGWRILHSKEVCNLYSSPNIIIVIKSKMAAAEHAAHKLRNVYKILVSKCEARDILGKLGIDERII
jgi:hypothetical protein